MFIERLKKQDIEDFLNNVYGIIYFDNVHIEHISKFDGYFAVVGNVKNLNKDFTVKYYFYDFDMLAIEPDFNVKLGNLSQHELLNKLWVKYLAGKFEDYKKEYTNMRMKAENERIEDLFR